MQARSDPSSRCFAGSFSRERGAFIQAWGNYGDPKEYRLIIDSLLNLPLYLKQQSFQEIPAILTQLKNIITPLLNTVIKADATTFHTYYFDPETGQTSHGATHQGNSDHSVWARGQSWAILGIPLNESYFAHTTISPKIMVKSLMFFLHSCQQISSLIGIFDFNDQTPSDKDSSALAIAACGLLGSSKNAGFSRCTVTGQRDGFISWGEHYAASQVPDNEGLLLHGVYAHAEGKASMNLIYGEIIFYLGSADSVGDA